MGHLDRPAVWRLGALVLVALSALACSATPAPAGYPNPISTITAPAPGASARAPEPSSAAACASGVLQALSVDQRIGQLMFMGLAGNQVGTAERAAIRDESVGSVWYTVLSSAPQSSVAATSADVQTLAPVASAGRLRLFVAANQEGGQIDQFHGPGFSPMPSAATQGSEPPSQLEGDASNWGRQLIGAGINLEVAPVMDTVPPGTDASNAPIGALDREFGHDPSTVTAHGVAFIRGMQGAGEAVTAKHFPGLGRVTGNTDFAASSVDSVTNADDPYLQPFADAIGAGTDMVMVSTALYTRIDPARLAAFSPAVIGLLRDRYHFTGVIVSDDLGAAASVQAISPGQRAVDFIAAGGDLITVKYASQVPLMTAALRARAQADPAFRQRVDEAALHVLEAKSRHGLLCA